MARNNFLVTLGIIFFVVGGIIVYILTSGTTSLTERMESGECSEILEAIQDSGNDAGLATYGRSKYEEAGC